MTLPVIFHESAGDELSEGAAYYASVRPGLGDAFLDEVEVALDALAEAPTAGAALGRDVRWWLLKRFPYSILYRVLDDHIRVLAIAHHRRRPRYWTDRR